MGVANLFPFRCRECAAKFYAFLEGETFAGHLPEQVTTQGASTSSPQPNETNSLSNTMSEQSEGIGRGGRRPVTSKRPRRPSHRGRAYRCSICAENRSDGED
jgi:hypothetical protein